MKSTLEKALIVVAVLFLFSSSSMADESSITGTYVSEDQSTTIIFHEAENPETAPSPGKPPVKIYRADIQSLLFGEREYRYEKTGTSLTVSPLLAEGAAADPVKNPIYRFSIEADGSLVETEIGFIYRKSE